MMGKRVLEDPRNELVFHYVRLVRELNPRYCVFENVKGLTVGKHQKFLSELIEELGSAGYQVILPYQVLNAADFGVPQNRHRLFLVAARKGENLPIYPLPISRVTVGEAIADLPNADDFEELVNSSTVDVKFESKSKYSRRLRGLEKDPNDYSYPRVYGANTLTDSIRTEHSEISKKRFRGTSPGTTEPISRFFKLDNEGLCNTIRAGTDSARGAFTSPRPIHPIFPRVITVREAARLHSYPDWFRFHATKWHGFRQIGNSVPPLLGRAVASQIVKALGVVPKKPMALLNQKNSENKLLSLNMGEAANYYSISSLVIAQRTRKTSEDLLQVEALMATKSVKTSATSLASKPPKKANRYDEIIAKIFKDHYTLKNDSFEFSRNEFEAAATLLKIVLPKNVGDVLYAFRYRTDLPSSITNTAGAGREWIIQGAGRSKYRFRLSGAERITPNMSLVVTKIPDSTPEIISHYALSDEQALLAKVRYNRLIDIFLGITAYSMQNHLRTTVKEVGQIEIDEIYVGIDKNGRQFVVPVQAKSGKDKHGVVQTQQDIACCAEKFPTLICRAVSAQFLPGDKIALFELVIEGGEVKIAEERHYQLVAGSEITAAELKGYSARVV